MLARIWKTKLSKEIISNCFRKAGIFHQTNNDDEMNETEDNEFDDT